MNYTTKRVLNLSTGKPFTFDVPQEILDRLENQKGLIRRGQAPALGDVENLTDTYEFSFFPAYKKILKIMFENGYTDELVCEILEGFDLSEDFIRRLLEDPEFVSSVRPWFRGITRDGQRASLTMQIVYNKAKEYFSVQTSSQSDTT